MIAGIYRKHFGNPHKNMRVRLKYFPQWKTDAAWFKPACSNLVKQGLKLMVIMLINQNHLEIAGGEFFGQPDAGKTRAHDYNALLLII